MHVIRTLASLTIAAFLYCAAAAQAIPIAYEFSGTVSSGSLNGVAFTDRAFTIDLFGDTSGVTTDAFGIFANPATAVTFTIAGVGGGTLSDAYAMFFAPTVAVNRAVVGFSNVSGAPADRVDVAATPAAFGGYTLAGAFGPITATGSDIFIGQFLPDPTSAGLLEMFDGPTSSVTFRSFFPATPVPAPAPLALIMVGLAALCLTRRTR